MILNDYANSLKLLVLVFAVFLHHRPIAAQEVSAQDLSSQIAAIVDSVGKQAIESDKVVGLTIGVAKNDKLLCVKPFGLASIEHSVPVTEQSVFRIGSITKPFTAVAVLLLIENGKLELDDRLDGSNARQALHRGDRHPRWHDSVGASSSGRYRQGRHSNRCRGAYLRLTRKRSTSAIRFRRTVTDAEPQRDRAIFSFATS